MGHVFGALELEAGYLRGARLFATGGFGERAGYGGLFMALALELALGGSANAH